MIVSSDPIDVMARAAIGGYGAKATIIPLNPVGNDAGHIIVETEDAFGNSVGARVRIAEWQKALARALEGGN